MKNCLVLRMLYWIFVWFWSLWTKGRLGFGCFVLYDFLNENFKNHFPFILNFDDLFAFKFSNPLGKTKTEMVFACSSIRFWEKNSWLSSSSQDVYYLAWKRKDKKVKFQWGMALRGKTEKKLGDHRGQVMVILTKILFLFFILTLSLKFCF